MLEYAGLIKNKIESRAKAGYIYPERALYRFRLSILEDRRRMRDSCAFVHESGLICIFAPICLDDTKQSYSNRAKCSTLIGPSGCDYGNISTNGLTSRVRSSVTQLASDLARPCPGKRDSILDPHN